MADHSIFGSLHKLARYAYRSASTDELLSRFAKDRDSDAFATLVERFRTFVLRRCILVLHSHDLALDATQETFIALARNAHRLSGTGKLIHWLEKVACNKAKDIRRREQRLGRLTASILPFGTSSDNRNNERHRRVEIQEQVNQAMAHLPRKFRKPLELCYLDGFTQREAAAILGVAPGTLAWRVQQGLELLKKQLSRHGLQSVTLASLPALFTHQAHSAMPVAEILTKAVLSVSESTGSAARLSLFGFLGSRGLTPIIVVTTLLTGIGMVYGLLWWTNTPQPPPVTHAVESGSIIAESQVVQLQRRTDRVFAPVIAEVEKGLRQMTFGNQGIARFREMRYHDRQPAAFFDWWHKHEQDGQVIFDKQFVVEVGYNASLDIVESFFYPEGIHGPKRRLDPDTPIILYSSTVWGVKVPLRMPWFQRARTALEEVRSSFVINRDRLDEAAKSVVPKLEALLKQMTQGNEGSVVLEHVRYGPHCPLLKFRWRHRQVTAGQVVFDRIQSIEFEYVVDYHSMYIAWHQTDGHVTIWKYLAPESNYPIFPQNPVGDSNPRLPAELLSAVPEMMEPIVRATQPPDRLPAGPPQIVVLP